MCLAFELSGYRSTGTLVLPVALFLQSFKCVLVRFSSPRAGLHMQAGPQRVSGLVSSGRYIYLGDQPTPWHPPLTILLPLHANPYPLQHDEVYSAARPDAFHRISN